MLPSDVANGTGRMASKAAAVGMEQGGYMCAHTHFLGPFLTSRDWEKFTYTSHFHMSHLVEATICVAVQC